MHLSLKLRFTRHAHAVRVRYDDTVTKQSFADSGVTKPELGHERTVRLLDHDRGVWKPFCTA